MIPHGYAAPWRNIFSFRTRSGRQAMLPVLSLVFNFLVSPAFAQDATEDDVLDFSKLELTFDENFVALDVSPWGPGTRWIAHTPWYGDFGGAQFTDPKDGFPFSTENGILRIEASRDENSKWRAGLLASANPDGDGFSQQYGYFEMRAKLPTGPAVWAAFWLVGIDRSDYIPEIDVLEFYGDRPGGYDAVTHVWHNDGRHDNDGSRIKVFEDNDPEDFHTYGALITESFIRIYFDRKMVWKTRTLPEHRQPMLILLNLAMEDKSTLETADDPNFMYVDYVRAFALKE